MHHDGEVWGNPPDGGILVTNPEEGLKAERVQLALRALPGWAPTSDGEGISRAFQFQGSGSTLLFAALVGAMGWEVGRVPVITVLGQTVVCQLFVAEDGGVADEDVALARRISLLEE